MVTKQSFIQLRDFIFESYNLEDLRTLCFELKVDYDELYEGRKSTKVQDLILLMGKRKRLEELLQALQRQRELSFQHYKLSTEPQFVNGLYNQLNSFSQRHFLPQQYFGTQEYSDHLQTCNVCNKVIRVISGYVGDNEWHIIGYCTSCKNVKLIDVIRLGTHATVAAKEFTQKHESFQDATEKTQPTILVWGPEHPYPSPRRLDSKQLTLYGLRRRVVNQLLKKGYLVRTTRDNLSQKSKQKVSPDCHLSPEEYMHTQEADCILVINNNLKSASLFSMPPEILEKMIIFTLAPAKSDLPELEGLTGYQEQIRFLEADQLNEMVMLHEIETWIRKLSFAKHYQTLDEASKKDTSFSLLPYLNSRQSLLTVLSDQLKLFILYFIRTREINQMTEIREEFTSEYRDLSQYLNPLEKVQLIKINHDKVIPQPQGTKVLDNLNLGISRIDLLNVKQQMNDLRERIEDFNQYKKSRRDLEEKIRDEIPNIIKEADREAKLMKDYAKAAQDNYGRGAYQAARAARISKETHLEHCTQLNDLVNRKNEQIDDITLELKEAGRIVQFLREQVSSLSSYHRILVKNL